MSGPDLGRARQLLAEGPPFHGRGEAEAAVRSLELGDEAAAARWVLRALLAHPSWRALARVLLGEEGEDRDDDRDDDEDDEDDEDGEAP